MTMLVIFIKFLYFRISLVFAFWFIKPFTILEGGATCITSPFWLITPTGEVLICPNSSTSPLKGPACFKYPI